MVFTGKEAYLSWSIHGLSRNAQLQATAAAFVLEHYVMEIIKAMPCQKSCRTLGYEDLLNAIARQRDFGYIFTVFKNMCKALNTLFYSAEYTVP